MVRKGFSSGRSGHREFIGPEVGLVSAEGHDHGQGRTDRPSFPVVQNRDHITALSLEVEGFTTVLWMVEHHDGCFNRHLVSGFHGIGI